MARWRIVLVVLLAFLGLPAHGFAQTKDELVLQAPTLSLSPSEGRAGVTVTASGEGYCGMVTLWWDDEASVLNSGEADADGNIAITFTVPEAETGQHTVASASDCGGTTASFEVLRSPPTTTTSPPTTTEPPTRGDTDNDNDNDAPPATRPPPVDNSAPPARPAPAPAPQPTPGGDLDNYDDSTLTQYEDIVKRELEAGVILYNPPEQMRVGEVNRVEVRIAREESDDLAEDLQGQGDPRIEDLLVGTTMRARLEGSAFDIIPIGSDVQQLMSQGFREWRWDVTPTASGNHPLIFIVSVLHKDYPNPIEEKVFERRIDVAVNPGYSLSKWLSNNWEKPIAALIGIIGIIEGYRRLKLRRTDDRAGDVAPDRDRGLKRILGKRTVRKRP